MPNHYGEGRRIAHTFFTKFLADGNVYICKCGKKRKRTSRSYFDLLYRVKFAHPQYARLGNGGDRATQCEISEFFITSKASTIYSWFDFVITALKPFSFLENKVFRRHIKHEPISISNFMRYMPRVVEVVEEKYLVNYLSYLPLFSMGRLDNPPISSPFYALFPYSNERGYETLLLTLSPMGDECSLSAKEHVKFIAYILELYGKSWSNICYLIGDNVDVRKSISNMGSSPFNGC